MNDIGGNNDDDCNDYSDGEDDDNVDVHLVGRSELIVEG